MEIVRGNGKWRILAEVFLEFGRDILLVDIYIHYFIMGLEKQEARIKNEGEWGRGGEGVTGWQGEGGQGRNGGERVEAGAMRQRSQVP